MKGKWQVRKVKDYNFKIWLNATKIMPVLYHTNAGSCLGKQLCLQGKKVICFTTAHSGIRFLSHPLEIVNPGIPHIPFGEVLQNSRCCPQKPSFKFETTLSSTSNVLSRMGRSNLGGGGVEISEICDTKTIRKSHTKLLVLPDKLTPLDHIDHPSASDLPSDIR